MFTWLSSSSLMPGVWQGSPSPAVSLQGIKSAIHLDYPGEKISRLKLEIQLNSVPPSESQRLVIPEITTWKTWIIVESVKFYRVCFFSGKKGGVAGTSCIRCRFDGCWSAPDVCVFSVRCPSRGAPLVCPGWLASSHCPPAARCPPPPLPNVQRRFHAHRRRHLNHPDSRHLKRWGKLIFWKSQRLAGVAESSKLCSTLWIRGGWSQRSSTMHYLPTALCTSGAPAARTSVQCTNNQVSNKPWTGPMRERSAGIIGS